MRIVMVSDTHNHHHSIDVPAGDLLLHCGDFTLGGTMPEILGFNKWLGTLPHRHKIVVCGNHDKLFESDPSLARSLLTNATYLQDEEVTIEGLRIYGSPWTPTYGAWSFMLERGAPMAERWERIPKGLDILITHGPPYGELDEVTGFVPLLGGSDTHHAGCEMLWKRIYQVRPRAHVFGHIHEAAGRAHDPELGITFINAAQLNRQYRPNGNVQVIDLEARG